MAEVGATYQPEGATAVVMDPRNGELLALANWPRVDANDPGGAPAEARVNRAVMSSFEPGSTFKAFTVAGALEERLIRPDSTLDVPPEIQVADRTIGEAHEGGAGTLTVADILARSSNVGSVMIGLELGAERFDKWVRRFGFGEPTGVSPPGRGRRHRAPARRTTRAPRSATCRSARAWPSPRCRWWRPTRPSPTTA